MNLKEIQKRLDEIFMNKAEKENCYTIQELAILQKVSKKINSLSLLQDTKLMRLDTQSRLKKICQNQRIELSEQILNISDEIEISMNNFKEQFIQLEEMMQNKQKSIETFNSNQLIQKFFSFIFNAERTMIISRNTGYQIWGFENKKQDRFCVKNLFMSLEEYHDNLGMEVEMQKLDEDILQYLKKDFKVDFQKQYYSLCMLIPQTKDFIESSIFFILELQKNETDFVSHFLSENFFQQFFYENMSNLMKLSINHRKNLISQEDLKYSIRKLRQQICYFSLKIYLFERSVYEDLHYVKIFENKIPEKELQGFQSIYLDNLNLSLLINMKEGENIANVNQLQKWLQNKFDNFIKFFENNLLAILFTKVNEDQIYMYTNKDKKVNKIQNESRSCSQYFYNDKEFKYNQNFDYYIKDNNFCSVLTKSFNVQQFLVNGKTKLKFFYENLTITIMPLFLMKDKVNESCQFLIRFKKNKSNTNNKIEFDDINMSKDSEFESAILDDNNLVSQNQDTQIPKLNKPKQLSSDKKDLFNKNQTQIGKIFERIKISILDTIQESNATQEQNIDEIIKQIQLDDIKDTIFSEYMKQTKFLKQGSEFPSEKNCKPKKSVIHQHLGTKQSSDLTDKNSQIDIQKLINYSYNFLNTKKLEKFKAIELIFQDAGIVKHYEIEQNTLQNFLKEIYIQYTQSKNPYHNFEHALTVMNGCYYFLKNTDVYKLFDDQGIAALLFSGLMHDIQHPGNNNDFEIKNGSELALRYNNRSVLENHHCYQSFKILRNDKTNIFKNMNKEKFNLFRRITIEFILMTDPQFHFENLKKLQRNISQLSRDQFHQVENFEAFILLGGNIVHAVDLHGPTKPIEEAKQWSKLINQEFFNQLEKEQELELPTNQFFQDLRKPKEQVINEIFFVQKIVKPLWVELDNFLGHSLKKELENIDKNLEQQEKKLEEIAQSSK